MGAEPGEEYEELPTNSVTTHLMAGAMAGMMEHCAMYPVDSIKVRRRCLQRLLVMLLRSRLSRRDAAARSITLQISHSDKDAKLKSERARDVPRNHLIIPSSLVTTRKYVHYIVLSHDVAFFLKIGGTAPPIYGLLLYAWGMFILVFLCSLWYLCYAAVRDKRHSDGSGSFLCQCFRRIGGSMRLPWERGPRMHCTSAHTRH
jgi:hypothetical protein